MSENTHFRVITPEMPSERCEPCTEIPELGLLLSREATDKTAVAVGMESDTARMETETVKAGVAESRMACDMEDNVTLPPGKTDSPTKRKGKMTVKVIPNIPFAAHFF